MTYGKPKSSSRTEEIINGKHDVNLSVFQEPVSQSNFFFKHISNKDTDGTGEVRSFERFSFQGGMNVRHISRNQCTRLQ